eukprot:6484821-Amphidinium_carterae.1
MLHPGQIAEIAKIHLACYQGDVQRWASSLEAHIKLNQKENMDRIAPGTQLELAGHDFWTSKYHYVYTTAETWETDCAMAESVVRTSDLKDTQGVKCVMDTSSALEAPEACPVSTDVAVKAALARGTKVTSKLTKVGQSLGRALTSQLMAGQTTHTRQLAKWQEDYQ